MKAKQEDFDKSKKKSINVKSVYVMRVYVKSEITTWALTRLLLVWFLRYRLNFASSSY